MGHEHRPPLDIDGFEHPHALTGIPEQRRPAWADVRCDTCAGRGCRNEILHLDSFRCRLAACDACEGAGWLATSGVHHRAIIVMVDGHPAWTVEHIQPTATITTLPTGRRIHAEDASQLADAA